MMHGTNIPINETAAPRYRALDPSLGRWTRQDPLGYVDGSNVYNYLSASPVDRTDPLGLTTQLPTPGVDGGVSGGQPNTSDDPVKDAIDNHGDHLRDSLTDSIPARIGQTAAGCLAYSLGQVGATIGEVCLSPVRLIPSQNEKLNKQTGGRTLWEVVHDEVGGYIADRWR